VPAERPTERKKLPINIRVAVLTEAGYRCAIPTCRHPITLEIHHIYEFHKGGRTSYRI